MTYRVLALDLDGTLLTRQHQIVPAVCDAIHALRERVEVILVTGRHHTTAQPYYRQLGLQTPIICCNGTYVYDYGRQMVVEADAIPAQAAAQFIALAQAKSHELSLVIYVTEAMVYAQRQPAQYIASLKDWAETCPADYRPKIIAVPSLEQSLAHNIQVWKFVVEGETEKIRAFADQTWIHAHFSAEQSWSNRMDFSWQGNSKGRRLLSLLTARHYSPAELVAIGDNDNDISMIRLAGFGVAMANANDTVKSCADCITPQTNEGRGVLDIIETYF
ncbi:Cof-type HAD-IIB family hydrolase [Mangrovibacter phragmitis]|uniref:Cof-type HAD-IIB family hydrolase n=1 Tax=Mangrovibacter phragmitis TaxID=1691903 RepID=UPI003369D6D7